MKPAVSKIPSDASDKHQHDTVVVEEAVFHVLITLVHYQHFVEFTALLLMANT